VLAVRRRWNACQRRYGVAGACAQSEKTDPLYVGGRWGRSGKSHRLPRPDNAQEGRGLPRLGVYGAYARQRLAVGIISALELEQAGREGWPQEVSEIVSLVHGSSRWSARRGIAGRGGRVAAPDAGDQAGAVARELILRHGFA
jgi:hypothetical protein